MNDIIVQKDEQGYYEFILSKEMIEKIKKIEAALDCGKYLKPLAEKMDDSFVSHVGELTRKLEMYLRMYNLLEPRENGYYEGFEKYDLAAARKDGYDEEYLNRLEVIGKEYAEVLKIRGFLRYRTAASVKKIINLTISCYETIRDMTYFRDFEREKETIFQNISDLSDTILNATDKEKVKEEYETAYQNKDLEKLMNILELVNQKILLEWQQVGNNLQEMTSDNFCFLGHSTNSTSHFDEFFHPLISTSLYNQDVNDTFKRRFGFIMKPENIVAADAKDLWINNSENEKEKMFTWLKLAQIAPPQKLLRENKKLLQASASDNQRQKIYSEVVLDVSKEFKPQGVFCFTNGALDCDFDYVAAKELAKNNNLPLYTFDVLEKKSGFILQCMQIELIKSVAARVSNKSLGPFEFDDKLLDQYQYFLQKFTKLKKTGNYTKEQIMALYKRNNDLLTLSITRDELFSGEFSDEEIKVVLQYNFKYNIAGMAKEQFYYGYILKAIVKELAPHYQKLDKYYPGLSKFVLVLSKLDLSNEDIINKINAAKLSNLSELADLFIPEVKQNLISSKTKEHSTLDNLQKEFNSLKKEAMLREQNKQEYNYYYHLDMEDSFFKYYEEEYEKIKQELAVVNQDLEENSKKKEAAARKKQQLERQIEQLQESLNKIETVTGNSLKSKLEQEQKLSKHPYRNYFKLKKLSQEIEYLKIQQTVEETKKRLEIYQRVNALQSEIERIENVVNGLNSKEVALNDKKIQVENELNSQEHLLQENFGSIDIEEIKQKLAKAKEVIANYDYHNNYYLEEINSKLQELAVKITKLKQQVQDDDKTYNEFTNYLDNHQDDVKQTTTIKI